MRCPECTAAAPSDARFCPACATPLRVAARAGRPDETRTSLPDSTALAGEAGRFAAGTVLGDRYRVVGLLGRGGMGEVYRADDLKLGRPVALKFLPPAMERDPARLVRLLNEVRTALRVTHPNVCRVHDLGDIDGRHYLSMEYVDGEDLATLLRRIGRLPEERAIRAARQLCAGLAAAHGQGVLHRDLKPANVMIDGRGEVKITDFGLAAVAGDVRGEEVRAGTPAYMAPEQLDGREVTPRSDIYALGLVLYELFSGKTAFPGRTREEIAARRETPPTSLSSVVSGLDPAVARVVERCLASDPADRPASALAVSAALPGGDPLAAALAAGETPSPDLVAEAGASGGLTPRSALSLAAWIAVAVTAAIPLSRDVLLASRARLDRPPEVLADEAREVIRAAGWGADAVDDDFEFVPNWPLLTHLRSLPAARGRWDLLERGGGGLLFAYRESPVPLERMSAAVIGERMSDPPPTRPGMVQVTLDSAGRLRRFHAVPPALAPGGEPAALDWSPLLAAAGLDPAALTAVEPMVRPPAFSDRRFAWKGGDPAAGGGEIRIEAAALDGRPVAFAVLDRWEVPDVGGGAPAPGSWQKASSVVRTAWWAIVVGGAAIVAVRNVRLGRGDRRTALRLGLYLGAVRLVWLLDAHHPASRAEIDLIIGHSAYALYRLGLVYLFYLALEPYARRLWPEMLVSWVRVFSGRFRDARVGRDVLIGVACGCAIAVVMGTANSSLVRLGLPDYGLRADLWSYESLRHTGAAVGSIAALHGSSVLENFIGVMLFLVLRITTRRTWIAVAVTSSLAAVMYNPGSGVPWPYLASVAIVVALFWVMLFRAGLLALLVGFSVEALLGGVRLTWDLGAWHARPMLLAIAAVVAAAAWGFWASLAGRPLFRDEIQEEALR